jgi:hypothetical protein
MVACNRCNKGIKGIRQVDLHMHCTITMHPKQKIIPPGHGRGPAVVLGRRG